MSSVATRTDGAAWRLPAVVLVYTVAFFGALPAFLWSLGGRFDAALGLAPPSGLAARSIGLLALGAGVAWMLVGMGALRWLGRGWPISHLPPSELVGRGVYAWSRHPVYVGYTLAFGGAGLASGSLGRGVLAPALLTLGWIIYAAGFEEPRLRARFGAAYVAYARNTPLLPFTRPLCRPLGAMWLGSRTAVERLANRTVLFRAGSSIWVTYGAFVALGAAVATATHATLLAGLGLEPSAIAAFHLGLGLAMLAGGRLVWLAYEWRAVARDPSVAWRRVGFVSFGGYVGLVAFTAIYARHVGIDEWVFFDRTLPVAWLISACGRLGCLSYGCCWGKPCERGVRWTAPAAKVNRERGAAGPVPRVPTPLLASGYALVAAALGAAALGRAPGAATAASALAYGVLRFGVEIWRDEPRFTRWQLTRGQIVSASMVLAAVGLWFAIDGPPSPVRFELTALTRALPAALGVALMTFAVCGYHRKEVGRW